jgi:Uri superfamily endonuclease
MIMKNGIYILVILINKSVRINVGVLGSINLDRGLYAYVGSAQKSLEKRVERHLRKVKQKFWHIDYLLDDDNVRILEVFLKEAEKMEECKTAKEMSQKYFSIEDFGSSDCKCKSHFFKLRDCQLEGMQHLSAYVRAACESVCKSENGWMLMEKEEYS